VALFPFNNKKEGYMLKLIGLIAIAVATSGCSTTAIAPSKAVMAKSENLYSYQTIAPGNDATMVVTRDSGFMGRGCANGFFINGKLAAKLDVEETANFNLPSGTYLVGHGPVEGRGLCGFAGKPRLRERETAIKPMETKRFRLFIDQDGNFDILPTSLQ
jgi:hypothetical protein